jgi:hypothetical protein
VGLRSLCYLIHRSAACFIDGVREPVMLSGSKWGLRAAN